MLGFQVRRSLRFSPLVWLLALGACTSVLGIEDLHEGPRGDSGGADTNGGTDAGAGKNNAGGNPSGSAGKSSAAGTGLDEGGDGNQTTAGTGNGGSAGSGGTGTDAGAGGGPPVDGAVHGTLIDFWGHALGNQALKVADQVVTTDKDGKFTVDDAPAEYDVSLKLSREENSKVYGWVFLGLTRRDPTLQVYQAREDRYTNGYVKVTATLGATDTVSCAFGSADGTTEKKALTTDVSGNYFSPNWQGTATNTGTAHALQWTRNAATLLPTAYKSSDSKLVALAEGTALDITFDLKAQVITSGALAGTATPYGEGDRTNAVFVRYSTGASLQIVDQTPTVNAFSYVVPALTKASISVAASEEDTSSGAYSIVHKDGLSPGDAVGTLAIPAPVSAATLNPSMASDMADATTPFTFSGSADSKGAFVVHIEAAQFYQAMYVVTSKKSFKLPTIAGWDWISGRVYYWRVETHGAFSTVDQMTEGNGFADAYYGPTQSTSTGTPQGLRQESGSLTVSGKAFFTRK